MSWTYDFARLADEPIYQIRNEVGDVNPNRQLLQDEEISFCLSQERNFWSAAARCAEIIGRGFLSKADVRLGRSLMVTYTGMAEAYMNMAKCLRRKAMGTVVPWVGGMSVADKLAYQNEPDLVQPAFTRDMQINPWTGGYTSDTLAPVGGGNAVDEDGG